MNRPIGLQQLHNVRDAGSLCLIALPSSTVASVSWSNVAAPAPTIIFTFMHAYSVTQSCPTCNPMDCSLPGYSPHGILPSVSRNRERGKGTHPSFFWGHNLKFFAHNFWNDSKLNRRHNEVLRLLHLCTESL